MATPIMTPPSIFISSTVKEFYYLRSALSYTLRKLGFNVYMSEDADFEVIGDRPAGEECFKNICKSDYYVLLIGNTQGSIYEDGVSITRQEYRVARKNFIDKSRPRLLLFLREETDMAMQNSLEVQKKNGIDNPEHLAAFINEVRHPEDKVVTPSYLKPFKDFEDLMRALEKSLNLGRTVPETLLRHSLLSELLLNLSMMVQRFGNAAIPHHDYMNRTRQKISSISPDDYFGKKMILDDSDSISLASALINRARGSELRTKAIEEALSQGMFLTFDPLTNKIQESVASKELRRVRDDISYLINLDRTLSDDLPWDLRLLSTIVVHRQRSSGKLEVQVSDVASALTYYDRITDIFNGHVALCKILLGVTKECPSYIRQPQTIFGEKEMLRLQAERVSAEEIARLLENNIWPFGDRFVRTIFGTTKAVQINTVVGTLSKSLNDMGIDSSQLEDSLKKVAEDYIEKNFARPDDGIDHLQPD